MRDFRIDFKVSHILADPERQWTAIRGSAAGKVRTAFRDIQVDWKKYNTKDYLFTHDTACCSVATEQNGYWITPPCWELVNANGNAWTTPVLLASFKTFVGGDNFLEHCFVKGTRVLMADGSQKPIEEMAPGDMVVTHTGASRPVRNLQVRVSSDLYEISSQSLLDGTVVATGSHPFYVVNENNECVWKRVKDIDEYLNFILCMDASRNVKYAPFSKTRIEGADEQVVYNIEVEGDNSYVAEGAIVHNCQIPALSKGKILDAIARPVVHHSEQYGDANIYYVDVLVATDRKHTSLIERIESGKLNTLSMGTLAEVTQCSICGKRIYDGDKNCEHLDRHVGQMVTCSDGKDRVCAELCGACDDHGDYIENSNSFIEISWVEHPAFKGAVVNSFIETEEERELRESSKNDLEKLFSENLFERLRVADRDTSIALKITREITKADRIAEKIVKKLDE